VGWSGGPGSPQNQRGARGLVQASSGPARASLCEKCSETATRGSDFPFSGNKSLPDPTVSSTFQDFAPEPPEAVVNNPFPASCLQQQTCASTCTIRHSSRLPNGFAGCLRANGHKTHPSSAIRHAIAFYCSVSPATPSVSLLFISCSDRLRSLPRRRFAFVTFSVRSFLNQIKHDRNQENGDQSVICS
jgi:hypothetical protein